MIASSVASQSAAVVPHEPQEDFPRRRVISGMLARTSRPSVSAVRRYRTDIGRHTRRLPSVTRACTVPSSPRSGAAARRGIPDPHRRGMGRVLATSSGANYRWAPAAAPTPPPASTSTPASAAAAAARPRPAATASQIRDQPDRRISEAQHEHWTGEAEGLQVSLAPPAANSPDDQIIARRGTGPTSECRAPPPPSAAQSPPRHLPAGDPQTPPAGKP